MLRNNHEIMIEQQVGDENHWAIIRLIDQTEDTDSSRITGKWRATDRTYNDKEPYFTSASKEYWYWEWTGPHRGTISIGTKMGRASHKEGEDFSIDFLITLTLARRTAGSRFEVGSVLKNAPGTLTYNVGNDFVKGDILWSMTRYEQ